MKKSLLSIMILSTSYHFAQENKEIVDESTTEIKEKKFSFEGSVDAYYQTNLTSSDKAIFGEDADAFQSFGTSFADETGFALGMANIIAKYEGKKTGVVADLVFGPRGDAAVGEYNINQLYVYWDVSEGTTLTLGRFNTYLGYEVISPTGNFNYSTSYLFSSGPFSHVGLKADFTLSDDFSLMVAVMNPTDVNNNTIGGYAFGTQLGYSGQFLNFYYDDNEILGFEVDYTGGFDISDSFYLGLNAAYADNEGEGFMGAAIYPQLEATDRFSIGLRGEYFDWLSDADAAVDDQDVIAITLTGSYTYESLTVKPELRLDNNSQKVYADSDLESVKNLAAFTVAAIYQF